MTNIPFHYSWEKERKKGREKQSSKANQGESKNVLEYSFTGETKTRDKQNPPKGEREREHTMLKNMLLIIEE